MKVLIGVDSSGDSLLAARMVLALKFPALEVELIHVVPSLFPDGSFPIVPSDHAIAMVMDQKRKEGQSALDDAKAIFDAAGVPSQTFLKLGDPVHEILAQAERSGANLVAIHSTTKSYYSSMFFGSVAKGLVIGAKASVLIVKGETVPSGPIKAVFATDHSAYINNCLSMLVEMNPKGLGSVTSVTANELATNFAGWGLPQAIPSLAEGGEWTREALEEKNIGTVAELAKISPSCHSLVIDAHPNDAIREAMDSTNADLLIVGAQGHGFLERVMLGSKSMHQVMNEPHSVLVLRA